MLSANGNKAFKVVTYTMAIKNIYIKSVVYNCTTDWGFS